MPNDILRKLPVVLIICGALLGTMACEDDSNDGLSVSPTNAKIVLADPEPVVLTASGGDPEYTWTVSDPSLGTLATAQDTAIYTSYSVAGQNFITVHDSASSAVTATITQF